MRKLLLFLVLSAATASAQQKPAAKPKPATPQGAAAANLPTEDEVNGFMHETFGYNAQLTWKIVAIKPAEAKGLTEVDVIISSPEGQGEQKFYVTEDGKHAVTGDVIPFGKHPFEATRLELQKKATGPARGPANASVWVENPSLTVPSAANIEPVALAVTRRGGLIAVWSKHKRGNTHWVVQSAIRKVGRTHWGKPRTIAVRPNAATSIELDPRGAKVLAAWLDRQVLTSAWSGG